MHTYTQYEGPPESCFVNSIDRVITFINWGSPVIVDLLSQQNIQAFNIKCTYNNVFMFIAYAVRIP